MQLPRRDRADLARELIASLDEPEEQDVEAAWLVEAERRLADVERGATKPVPWDAVRERIAERLRAKR